MVILLSTALFQLAFRWKAYRVKGDSGQCSEGFLSDKEGAQEIGLLHLADAYIGGVEQLQELQ